MCLVSSDGLRVGVRSAGPRPGRRDRRELLEGAGLCRSVNVASRVEAGLECDLAFRLFPTRSTRIDTDEELGRAKWLLTSGHREKSVKSGRRQHRKQASCVSNSRGFRISIRKET